MIARIARAATVLIIANINKILSLNNTPVEQRMIIQAVIIAVAVLIQQQKRRAR